VSENIGKDLGLIPRNVLNFCFVFIMACCYCYCECLCLFL